MEKLVTSDPERFSGFIMSTQRVSINRGKWTIPISRECETPDYLVPRDDLEMRNYGVITYDESTHNVDFVVFEDDGDAVMTAYAPLYIMEYPDVGFIAVDRAATYSAPGYRYSLTLYDYSGNIVSNQTFSEISSTIDSFGLYMKSVDYNEFCVTDNGDIYIMTSVSSRVSDTMMANSVSKSTMSSRHSTTRGRKCRSGGAFSAGDARLSPQAAGRRRGRLYTGDILRTTRRSG